MKINEALARMEMAAIPYRADNQEVFAIAGYFCRKIIEAFQPTSKDDLDIGGSRIHEHGETRFFPYSIERNQVVRGESRVLADRDRALLFLRDVNDGLLEVIAGRLAELVEEAKPIIATAKNHV